MAAEKRCRWGYCILIVLLAVTGTVPAFGGALDFRLSHTTFNETNNQTGYHYVLTVNEPGVLIDGSTLQMRGMDGVSSQGDTWHWSNAGITSTSAKWLHPRATPLTEYRFFDVIADASKTTHGVVDYEVKGETGQIGTVEGPVAIDRPEAYSVSGTVYLDGDGSGGSYNPPTDSVLPGVTVELIHSEHGVIDTTVSNLEINQVGEGYIGNYVFSDVPSGEYGVQVPATVEYGGETLEPTTDTLQWIVVGDAPVRDIDFGYRSPYEQEASVEVSAVVFFDVNQNGKLDDFEIRFEQVGVTLSGEDVETLLTGGDGYASFGEQGIGDYTISVTDGGPYKLLQYWTATTATSFDFSIDADTEGPLVFEFGFYPDAEAITSSDITGLNRSIGGWRSNIERAIDGRTRGDDASKAQLLAWLSEVETTLFPDIFDFGPDKLQAARDILHPGTTGNAPLDRLARQLLAAGLNWVSGFNSSEPALESMMLWWAQWVYHNQPEMADEVAALLGWWNTLGN